MNFTKNTWPVVVMAATLLTAASSPSQAEDKEIAALKQQLQDIKKLYTQQIEQLEARIDDLEESADEAEESRDQLAIELSQQSNQQAANTFNPGIGVVLNGKYSSQSPNDFEFNIPGFFPAEEIGPGESGLALGESELNLASNIDDKFFGSLTLSFGEGEANVEEAFLQTLTLAKGTSIKFGRFFSNIGYLARRHTHTDDFAERPLAYEALLGSQYGDDGIQLNWVAPTSLFWESGIELYRGENFPSAGASNHGVGVYTAYSHLGGDINNSQSWRAGISYLHADVDGRESDIGETFTGTSKLWIGDFVWKWAPDGNPQVNNAKIQGEYLHRKENGIFTDINSNNLDYNGAQDGWYLQAVYQFMPQWRFGARRSQLSADDLPASFAGTVLDNLNHSPTRSSLMLDWSNSEFSRLRLQFSRDAASEQEANIWTLQYIAAFGAHGAHTF
ncbi:MAG: hypothetical protein ACWA5R_08890 [bacterium]